MTLKCEWCQKRDALYELVAYHLHKEISIVANSPKTTQIVRGNKYVSVKVCEACLPVTKEADVLMGRNKKKPTNV